MGYNVKIDMSAMAGALHHIEHGNPVRHAVVPTLHHAISLCNLVRMAAGFSMLPGPRSIAPGQVYYHGVKSGTVVCEIQRLKGKA